MNVCITKLASIRFNLAHQPVIQMWLLKTDKVDVAIFYLQSMPQPLRPVFYNHSWKLVTCSFLLSLIAGNHKHVTESNLPARVYLISNLHHLLLTNPCSSTLLQISRAALILK